MFERFKKNGHDGYDERDRGAVATADRSGATRETGARETTGREVDTRERTAGEGRFERDRTATGVSGREAVRDVRARQREEYGGINWGAAFFGWLVAIGMAAILLGLLSAAGTAFGLGEVSESEANSNAETIGIVGGILLIVILVIAYYAGGYVAGRMARFNGPKQGLAVWVIGLLVTIVLAVAGAIFGSEYNIFESLNLPRIPIEEGSLTAGAAIALVLVLVLTLLAAMAGGKAGERYHRKIDRHGFGV